MNFLEAIHQGDLTAVRQQLAEKPALLNQADVQGNSPLHYAVARQDLVLIEFLIHQSADVTAKNHQEETVGEWYEEFYASRHKLEKLIDSKKLRQVIEKNGVQVIADYLRLGGSRSLRFSRGSTLLHLAVELQKPAIVQVILEGSSQKNINRLLNLKDSRGRTPLDLAQQFYQYGTPVAQQLFSLLQEKQHATAAEDSASTSQPLPTGWPFLIDKDFKNRINELSNKLKYPITTDDFKQLEPFREVIVQLAYITCRQALPRLSSLERITALEKTLLHRLFGSWCDNTRLDFQNKLQAIAGYLANLIQQQQVNQVIHFSNEISQAHGWHCFEQNRIYLNPTANKTNLIFLVVVLIHEATHIATQSYDFATMETSINCKGCNTIDFNQAYRLASTGEYENLTPERIKLFELRQLLQEGVRPDRQQRLNHWMALNNADTQSLAILLLATLPEKYAQVDKKQQTLLIKSEFLSAKYLKKHPAPLPLTGPCPPLLPEPLVMAAPSPFSINFLNRKSKPDKQQVTASPYSPRSDSSEDGWSTGSTVSRTPSPPIIAQEVAASLSSADQSGFSGTGPANRSWTFITAIFSPGEQ